MFVAPAMGLGLLFVFFVGALVTYAILHRIAEEGEGRARPYLYANAPRPRRLSEKWIERLAIVGGLVTVVLVVLVLLEVPDQWQLVALGALTVLGIILGLLTFLLR